MDDSPTAVPMQVDWDTEIPVSDGIGLRANVYRPPATGPVPVIVNMGPYGKDVPLSVRYPEVWAQLTVSCPEVLAASSGRYIVWEVPDPERWVPAGYALVHVDARGTGRSPGTWSPFSDREIDDFAEIVEWLAVQPWCTGRVGVLGVSYHAMAAWRLAERAPEHLTAIIPWHGAGDAYREAYRHGGILSNTFLDVWWHQCAQHQHGSPDGVTSPFSGENSTGPARLDLVERERRRTDLPRQARAHRLFDPWARAQAVDWSRIRVPFLSVAGLGTVGLHLRGNVEAFRHAPGPRKWLRLLATEGSGIERFHDDAGLALQRRFFDHFLLGVDNGWPDEPPVVYETREPSGSPRTGTATTWPPDSTRPTSLHLDLAARALTDAPPDEPASTGYWPRSAGVRLRSAPFAERTEVVGSGAVELTVSTTAQDVDLFATVSAQGADGRPLGPSAARGWLRLSHRALDPASSTAEAPVHTHRRVDPVTTEERYRVAVELWPASFAVPAGGTITLTVAGFDPADAGPTRHDDPDDRPAAVFDGWTILHTDPGHPARLLLRTRGGGA